MDWITGIQNAIDYMENHMTEPLDYDAIARASYASKFHFQRIFSILCGYTVGEYIRNRRLSLAGAEIASGTEKIIDIAAKYGYDSPDSFCRAFQKFHGITPSQARNDGANLKSFSRLSIKISLEGGSIMNYHIEEKPAMLLTGYGKRFVGNPNERNDQDHEFACANRMYQYILQGINGDTVNSYQILKDFTPDGYQFYFAHALPQWGIEYFEEDLGEMAKHFEHISIPAGLYMVAETERCEYPTALVEDLRKQAVTEWLPSSGYVLRDAPELNPIHWFFEEGNEALNHSRYCEIWLPIQKKS